YDPIHDFDIYYSVAPGQDASLIDWGNGGIVGLLTEPTDLQMIAEMVYYGAAEDPYTFSITFTLHLQPAPMVTVREALWGITGQYYIVEGVVEYFFDDWWIILSDETGTIYIDANSYSSYFGHTIAVGDTIRILGMRRGYENEDYVPILDSVADLEVLSHGAAPTRTPVTMTVEEMMALDYLCPDVYNQYVSITGTVIFSGNISYPSFDIREAGMPSDATYDIQIWSNTYYDFNDVMDPLVGSVIRVEGYLIGFQYIYAPFDWIVLHVNHEVLVP
ncbi:MAG TPA: hypothetical protein P5154_06140, partial [Candidatus Izemoplasmatales bacterium]|nr:hypothetical protein [Candidatus Izemoplasmatales bacterium]